MKIIAWIIFLILFSYLTLQTITLSESKYSLVSLTFAKAPEGKEMIKSWAESTHGTSNFLEIAKSSTKWDFVFIISYVLIIFILSNARMQLEKWLLLNEILRFNFFIAVLIGLADTVENLFLLHNFNHVYEDFYLCTCIPSAIKWVLVGWVLLTLLFSKIKSLIQ